MRRFLSVVVTLLALSASMAMIYEVENIKVIAFPNESLQYRLTITNNDTIAKQLYINKLYLDNTFTQRSIDIEPSINLNLGPSEVKVVNITIPVSEDLARGIYRTLYSTSLFVSYGGVTDVLALEAVIMSRVVEPIDIQNITVIAPASVLPTSDFNLTVTLLCNVESVSPLVTTRVSGDAGVVYESSSVEEFNRGLNLFTQGVKLPDLTLPGKYDVIVEVDLTESLVFQGTNSLIVNSYSVVNNSLIAVEDLFAKSVSRVIVNEGTEVVEVSVNYSATIIEPLLVSRALLNVYAGDVVVSSREVSFTDRLIDELVTLQPGQRVELVINFSYGVLLLIPFIIVISIIGWFFLTKRVSVYKEIIECRKDGEDIIVKVGLSVKNVSLNSIHDVRVVEDLPVYAKKAGGFGSIKGEVNRKRGVITFDAGRLDPKEEVLLSYKFKTDTELIGRIRLPPAMVKYKVNKKMTFTKSNTPIIHLIKGGQ